MSENENNSGGFTIVETLAIIVFLVLLASVGIFVFINHHRNSERTLNTSESTSLIIKRVNQLNHPGVDNFSKPVNHSSATTILSDINSLKPAPSGTYNCPNDDGIIYYFNFTEPTLSATASASGCQRVTVNNKSYQSTDKFWKDVSDATYEPIDPNKNF